MNDVYAVRTRKLRFKKDASANKSQVDSMQALCGTQVMCCSSVQAHLVGVTASSIVFILFVHKLHAQG